MSKYNLPTDKDETLSEEFKRFHVKRVLIFNIKDRTFTQEYISLQTGKVISTQVWNEDEAPFVWYTPLELPNDVKDLIQVEYTSLANIPKRLVISNPKKVDTLDDELYREYLLNKLEGEAEGKEEGSE
jgi:hypothetical protein